MAKVIKIVEKLDRIFALLPSAVFVDYLGVIQDVGPSLQRNMPNIKRGDRLDYHFSWTGGVGIDQWIDAIRPDGGVQFASKCGAFRLTGAAIAAEQGWLIPLRLMPTQGLLDLGTLQIADFGPDDPMVHSLLLLSMQKAMLEEAQETATELARARQRSQGLLDRISRVAGYMAHDFNNFLSIIRLNAQRITDDSQVGARTERLVRIIMETIDRGSGITRSLMTLSKQRYDSGTAININNFMKENLVFFRTIVGNLVTIDMDCHQDDVIIEANQVGLMNCVFNILINARDAMPSGGTINIVTNVTSQKIRGDNMPRDYYSIAIQDSGEGMSAEVLSQAFEPLFSTKSHGNGIGLASVLDFTREMGGDACIDSKPGNGTSLHMYIPVLQYGVSQTEPDLDLSEEPDAPIVVQAAKGHVLVLEDEPYALEALSEMLEGWGMAVTACATVEEAWFALKAPQSDPIRLIVCDVLLGTADGLEFAEAACAYAPDLAVILMSGYVPDAKRFAANWQFIRKPLNLRPFKDMVDAALGSVSSEGHAR